MGKFIDLTNQRFGRLTVVKFLYYDKKAGSSKWKCKCDCGNEVEVLTSCLRRGDTKSCGCLKIDVDKTVNVKHGKRYTRLYRVWLGMKDRCLNSKHQHFDRYGGKGIKVCEEWANDFQAFYDWAMVNGYDESAPRGQCTIDRIDNSKGYSPENCRWVSMAEQNKNKGNLKGE